MTSTPPTSYPTSPSAPGEGPKIGFGSDNHSGVHPEILAAIAAANVGHQPSYGTDTISERMKAVFESRFGAGTQAFYVFNGTAANVLSLAAALKPYQSVLCAESSHIHVDECAAPERVAGVKLLAIPTSDGKLRVADLERHIIRRGDQHFAQTGMVSITQPTELGTVYSLDELRQIGEFARRHGLLFHMDGARLVNAAVSLNVSLKAITRDVGVDILSLGGTKNGLLFGEAVVFFRSDLARDFKYVRKQLMQLPSKTRFVAAQFEAFLATELWALNADHANAMARRLSDGIRTRPFVTVTQETQANAVFACIPKPLVAPLRESYFFYVWNEKTFECRLMCTWDTTSEVVDGFLTTLDQLANRLSIHSFEAR